MTYQRAALIVLVCFSISSSAVGADSSASRLPHDASASASSLEVPAVAEQAWRPTTDGPVTISESDLRDVVATLSAIQGLFSESRQPVTGFLTATVTSNSSEPPDLKIGSITPVGESPLIENWIRPPGYQSPLLAMTREDFILLTDAQKAGLKARVEQLLRRYNGLLTEGQQNGSATQRSFVLDSDALP